MTSPTTADGDPGSKEPTVGQIDGFRGRLIRADHADYDIARAVWNGAIDLGGDEDPARIREAYGDTIYDRLVAVKTAYDPDNVFHHNQNIKPTV